MFTPLHFIWLSIALFTILFLLWITKTKHLALHSVLVMMSIVSILSEGTKILINIEYVEEFSGYYMNIESLPFHLCSIQIFFIFYLTWLCNNKEIQEKLLGFMFPTMLLGGILAMMIPTEGVSFTNIQTYQYFIFHIFIVYFALYLYIQKIIPFTFQMIKNNYIYLSVLMVIVFWIDTMLQYGGANFMYLTRPPMEGLPLLNLDHGWHIYFITLVIIALVVLFIVQVPFIYFRQNHRKEK